MAQKAMTELKQSDSIFFFLLLTLVINDNPYTNYS